MRDVEIYDIHKIYDEVNIHGNRIRYAGDATPISTERISLGNLIMSVKEHNEKGACVNNM